MKGFTDSLESTVSVRLGTSSLFCRVCKPFCKGPGWGGGGASLPRFWGSLGPGSGVLTEPQPPSRPPAPLPLAADPPSPRDPGVLLPVRQPLAGHSRTLFCRPRPPRAPPPSDFGICIPGFKGFPSTYSSFFFLTCSKPSLQRAPEAPLSPGSRLPFLPAAQLPT